MSLTPHGPGFSFLDVFDLAAPDRGTGRKWLDPALPFFADHFPGAPLMPGVLLAEAAAQAAGALWATRRTGDAAHHFVLAQIGPFKLAAPVHPGETIESDVIFEQALGPLAQFSVVVRVGEKEVARGRLVLSEAPESAHLPG